MPRNGTKVSLKWIKQPTADKEETRQTEQEKHIIIAHPLVAQTHATYMREDNKNHGESSHRINVFYSLFTHSGCKYTEKSPKLWSFTQKILPLHNKSQSKN